MYHKSEKTKRIIDCFHKDMQIIINMSVTHDVHKDDLPTCDIKACIR